MYRGGGKRAFDLVLTLIMLIVAFPFIVVLAVLVRWKLGTPVLFRQERPGLHERHFTLLKFRTMTTTTDQQGKLLPDAERLTPFGRFLRRSSLDELPELINVLQGDMSLVGPRPLLVGYLPYYSAVERKRFTVRPGITGQAQVNGRNAASWNARLAHDVYYAEHYSLALDLSILARTFLKVVRSEDVAVDPGAVMQDFDVERRHERSIGADSLDGAGTGA